MTLSELLLNYNTYMKHKEKGIIDRGENAWTTKHID